MRRPNILWIVSEDNSASWLGCYGNEFVNTPNLDNLAKSGLKYTNAFASAPVCAPARFCLATGMYAVTSGTQHMRSKNEIPERIKFFSEILRENGYYCINNPKEDYNTPKPEDAWDESSNEAHWSNRKKDQPFFGQFNIGQSHESCLFNKDKPHKKIDIAPFHPDTIKVREAYNRYVNAIEYMDEKVGKLIKRLKKDGIFKNTIIIYFGDHGGALPGTKRHVIEKGLRVPLIVHFPEKWQHLAPAKPGSTIERLVSFVDFGPSVLSLAGISAPEYMQGKAFMGPYEKEEKDFTFAFRGRTDERVDMSRSLRNNRFRYIRNYMPELPRGQTIAYRNRIPMMREWRQLYKENKLNEKQKQFFEEKPREELYDCKKDPYNVVNLIDKPEYNDILEEMRKQFDKFIIKIRDSGFLPEGELVRKSKNDFIYNIVRDYKQYPLNSIKNMAELAGERNTENISRLKEAVLNGNDGERFWGTKGLVMLKEKAEPATACLRRALKDDFPEVQVNSAEALLQLGEKEKAYSVINRVLNEENKYSKIYAANVLSRFQFELPDYIKKSLQRFKDENYISSQFEFLS